VALVDDLVSFWELEEASSTREDAHGSNDLTDNNTVTSGTGIVGTAASLAMANSEYFSHASNASLQMGDIDFTIAMWVNLASDGTVMKILAKDSGAANAQEYAIDMPVAQFRFLVDSSSATYVAQVAGGGGLPPATATWHFVVGWHDAVANTVNVCANDGAVASTSTSGQAPVTGASDFNIGRRQAGDFYTDGLIDQVGIWKRKLTSDEITYLYNSGNGRSYADFAVRRFLLARP
jgi:hypothetical protein